MQFLYKSKLILFLKNSVHLEILNHYDVVFQEHKNSKTKYYYISL